MHQIFFIGHIFVFIGIFVVKTLYLQLAQIRLRGDIVRLEPIGLLHVDRIAVIGVPQLLKHILLQENWIILVYYDKISRFIHQKVEKFQLNFNVRFCPIKKVSLNISPNFSHCEGKIKKRSLWSTQYTSFAPFLKKYFFLYV